MLRLYRPCMPTPSKVPPAGPEWVHEIKHDGYHIIARWVDLCPLQPDWRAAGVGLAAD